jgi:hypothetical protein
MIFSFLDKVSSSHDQHLSRMKRNLWGIPLVLAFGAVGVLGLNSIQAATFAASGEAEDGAFNGSVVPGDTIGASKGGSVKFATPGTIPPTPPTPPPTGGAYRAFTAASYWNTPFPANAPIDPNSDRYIADSVANSQNYLNLVMNANFGQPIYFSSASDPLYSVVASGMTVQVHIPAGAGAATGSDGQFVVFDRSAGFNRVVGLHAANFVGGKWTANGVDTYQLDGNGLDKSVGGDSQSTGHRGVNGAVRAIRFDEVQAGAVNHRTECFWHATADGHFFPMSGSESGKGGIVPEGLAIRIKPNVNLDAKGLKPAAKVIATSLQKYGCVIGDNSGSGNNLKVQNNANWGTTLAPGDLKSIPWSEWEFVKAGYDPTKP